MADYIDDKIVGASAAVNEDEPAGITSNASAACTSNKEVELVPMYDTKEANVKFIVTDETNTDWRAQRAHYSLPMSTAVADLYDTVAKGAVYVPGSFSLFWRMQTGKSEEDVEIIQHSTATLNEMKMPEEPLKTYILIREKDGTPPVRASNTSKEGGAEETSNNADQTVSTNVSGSSGWQSYSNPSYNNNYYSSNSGYGSYYAKSDTGFVGLVNQAMTCYLNSLLQTLYMTPEFRNAIYRWRFVPKEEEKYMQESAKCIPHQLQRLFLSLQCSDKRSVETTDITTSFGWDGSEAWQQHDVQELCRVMFDALEKRFKKDKQVMDQVDLINELYQGKWKDYVQCKVCKHESSREDTFLDIPLVIKPFGMSITYGSVEEALKAFVEPETLDGDNQYFCERCNQKQDAEKGLKFQTFPYLLTLQLKRFDFDYSTMHRIKLNDRMTFPKLLNLNSFVKNPPKVCNISMYEKFVVDTLENTVHQSDHTHRGCSSASYNNIAPDLPPTYAEATGADKPSINIPPTEDWDSEINGNTNTTNTSTTAAADVTVDSDNGKREEKEKDMLEDKTEPKEETLVDMLKQGPYVYELFSIMIHSGSAIGGHYYAYIKSLKDRKWYCFNDQSVSRITQEDIDQTFGGVEKETKGYYSSMYSSSANAYMLMYRRISHDKNEDFIVENGFPEHLKQEIEYEKQKIEEKKRKQEMEKKMCKFKLFGHDFNTEGNIIQKLLEVNEDCKFVDAVKEAHKVLGYQSHVPLERCRLVKYDDYSETIDQSLDLDEFREYTFGQVVGGARSYYSFELFLETRKEHEVFKKYNKGGMKLKLLLVNLESGEITPTLPIRAEHGWTVGQLKEFIGEIYKMEPKCMDLALELYNDGKYLPHNDSTLRSEGLYRKHAVFVSSDPYDCQKPYNDSLFCKHIETYVNSIQLNITLPPLQDKLPATRPEDVTNSEVVPDLVHVHDVDGTGPNNAVTDENNKSNNDKLENIEESDNKPENNDKSDNNDTPNNDSIGPIANGVLNDTVTASTVTNATNGHVESHVTSHVTAGADKDSIESKQEKVDVPKKKKEVPTAGKTREIQLRVDRRTTLEELKKKLEPHVGIESIQFKMYRVYNNQQEYEMERLTDTLMSTPSESKIVVRLGRALQPGEHRVKLYLLQINEPEFFKLLMECIVSKNTSISDFRKEIEIEAIKQGVECELKADRMRLRKKVWRTPGTIYTDNLLIDKDVYVYAGSEMFVEPLENADPMKTPSQMQVYVRRWRPSEYVLDPYKEVVLDTTSVDELRKKVSEIGDLPLDRLSIAKGMGSFPADISVLDVESDLDWDPAITKINQSPFSFYDDGGVIYYKDSQEKPAELSTERKNELRKSENLRLSKNSIQGTGSSNYSTSYSSSYYRKEKALKIYTEDDTTTDREA